MPVEQAASTPPEPESYDTDFMSDVTSAYKEEATKEPEVVAEKPAEVKTPDAPAVETTEPKAEHPSDPTRYADGTFKPTKVEPDAKEVAKPVEVKPAESPKTDQPKVAEPAQQHTPTAAVAPPPGWSVKSKSAWDAPAPTAEQWAAVKADAARREQEVQQGFAQYEGLRPVLKYAEMARQRGTTLEASLDRYVGIENLLSKNLLEGLLHIAGNAGVHPAQLANALAPYAASQPAAQDGQAPAFDPNVLQQHLMPLQQKLSQFEQLFQHQQMSTVNGALERFKSDPVHRYYANVEPSMVKLLEGGIVPRTGDHYADLKSAYELACRMHPEVNELLVNEKIASTEEARRKAERDATEKAKLASRSIAGSSTSSANPDNDPEESIEETVRKAVRAHAA